MKTKILLVVILIFTCIVPVHAQEKESLMIVAHPDDETIFGGTHLLKGQYTVLCITNGDNPKRKKEFLMAMKKANAKGIILSYPDKTHGQRDQWKKCYLQINRTIRQYINKKQWNQVVTHNPQGEYGHIHHKMISKMVTGTMKEENKLHQLIYFGRYVPRKQKLKLITRKILPLTQYYQKQSLIKCYPSQEKVMQHLRHILPYENWVTYSKW